MAAPMLRRLGGLRNRFCGAGAGLLPHRAPRMWAAGYHAKPLGLDLSGFFLPGPESPEWQRDGRAQRKHYGRWGAASGVPAASLWPDPGQLRQAEQHQRDWEPGLREMWSSLAAQELEKQREERERRKLIATSMAKMPKMVEDWRREKRELKAKQRADKSRRERLLAEARERFGYSIDPRNSKFQEMLKELEKEEKKKQKLMKRRQKVETAGGAAAAVATS